MKCLFTLLHSLLLNMCDIFRGIWLSSRGWPPLADLTWGRWDDHMTFLILGWWLWASSHCMRHMRHMTTYTWEGRVTYLWQWVDVHEPSMMACCFIRIHWLSCLIVCDVYPCMFTYMWCLSLHVYLALHVYLTCMFTWIACLLDLHV